MKRLADFISVKHQTALTVLVTFGLAALATVSISLLVRWQDLGKAIKRAERIEYIACKEREKGWDNRRHAWIVLTTPPIFDSTRDNERLAAERAIVRANKKGRTELLIGLGSRPTCGSINSEDK